MTVNSVAAGIIVARWLGAEGLGQLAVINVAVASFVQLGSAGLPSANTYFIAQDRRRLVPVAMNSLVFALAAGGGLGLGLALLASARPAWFGFVSPSLVSIAAVSIPFQLITVIGLNIFLALGRVEAFNLLDLIGQAFVVINAVVVLIIFSSGLWTLVSFNTAVSVAIALLIIALVTVHGSREAEKKGWRTDGELFGRMIRYGIKFHISILAGALIFRADLLVVNYFRGAAEAGVYSVASQVAMMLMVLPGVIGTLLFPRIASDPDPHGELTSRVTRHTAFIMLVVCLATAPLSLVLPVLYGRAFAEASIQLLILLPGVFLIGIESVLAQHFSAIGLPRTIPIFWLVTLFVNLVLVLALVPPFGGRGAAAASTVSYTLIFGLIILYFRRQSGTSISDVLFINGLELRQLVSRAGLGRRHLN
jgi:O-antigen/teichoic acid export membrane protein